MTAQLTMTLPDPNGEDNGLSWVIYVEREVRGQEEMVLLLDEEGQVWIFDNYEDARVERYDHPLSVIGTVNIFTSNVTSGG